MVARLVSQSCAPDLVAQRIADGVREILDVDNCAVHRLDPDSGALVAVAVSGDASAIFGERLVFPKGTGLVGLAIERGRPMATPDVLADRRVVLTPELRSRIERAPYRAVLAVPLVGRNGPIGVLGLGAPKGRRFARNEIQLVQTFADFGALALETGQLGVRLERLQALTRLNQFISGSLEMDEVLREIARAAATLMRGAIASFALVDHPEGTIELRAWSDEAIGAEFPLRILRRDEGILGWIASHRERVKIDEAQTDPRMVGAAWLRAHGLTSYLGLPVMLENRLLAILSLNGRAPFVLSEEDRDLLDALVGQAAVAIRNARLYHEAERGRREAEVVAQVAQTINSSLDLESILRQVTDAARSLCEADAARIGLYEAASRTLRFVYWVGSAHETYETLRIEPGRGLGGHVLVSGQPIRIRSYLDDPRFSKEYAHVNLADGILAELVVPIRIEGRVEGLLYISHRTPREFTEHDETLAVRLADHAAVAITNTRLLAAAQAGRGRAEALAELGRTLVETLDPRVASQRTVEHARNLLGAQNAAAFRMDERGGLTLIASSGDLGPALASDLVLPPGHGVAGLAVSDRRACWTPDLLEDPQITLTAEARTRFEQSPHRAVLAVPLFVQDAVVGALSIGDHRGRTFEPDDVELLQAFGAQAALSLENARLHAESERQRREAEALAEVGRAISASLDVENILALITERVCTLLGTQRSAVALTSRTGPGRLVLSFEATRGLSRRFSDLRPAHARDGTTIAAITERRPVWSADLLNDPAFDLAPATRAFVEDEGYRAALSVPLIAGERAIGALVAYRDDIGPFSPQQVGLLRALADHAALALANASLYQDAERRRREAEELARIAQTLTERLDVATVGDRVVESARAMLRTSSASLRLVQHDGSLAAVAVRGVDHEQFEPGHVLPSGEGLVGETLRRGEAVQAASLEAHLAFVGSADLRARLTRSGLRAMLAVPLRAKGRSIGVLSVSDGTDRAFTEPEVALLRTFADQAALGLENAQLFEDAERRRRETEVLAALAQAIGASLDLGTVLQRVAEGARDLTGSDIASIGLVDPVRGAVQGRYRVGGRRPGAFVGEIPTGQGLAGKIMQTGRPLRTANYAEDPAISKEFVGLMVHEEGVVTGLGVPVTIDGGIEGVLAVWNRVARPFTDRDETLLQRLADQAAIAIKNAQLFSRERESERRYRALLESSIQGIHIHRDWVILFANAAYARMLGYDGPQDLVGVDARRFIAPEEMSRIEAYASARFRGEAASQRYEYRGLTRDGTAIWLEVQPSVVQWEGGPAILATFFDVTERKRAEEALRQSEAQLRQAQKMEAVGRLAGGIAHDFNNLLTVITGRSELLLMRLPPEDPRRRDIELIKRTGQRAATLTRQLLAFSRKQMLQPRVLHLNEVVASMTQMLERLIGEHIELVTLLAPDLGLVRADPAQLEQIILNLVVNARDAMPRGGRLTVTTANAEIDEAFIVARPGASPGSHAMLSVVDTGHGMTAETLAHVFEPFFTTKEVGKGTGLGLATVYGIVKQHEGYVHVDSVPGEGTAVRIYLKRVTPPEPAEARQDWHEPRERAAGTILLVEDEEAVRALAAEILQAAGYTVLVAADPGVALELAAAHDAGIDLLLTDVVMPVMSGHDLADRLRPGRPGMRVLYMSGYTDDAIVHHGGLEAGAELLQKPFTPDGLTEKVRELLG